jgi:hypothetical protein
MLQTSGGTLQAAGRRADGGSDTADAGSATEGLVVCSFALAGDASCSCSLCSNSQA